MNLVFLGPPGSGKGTQAANLSEKMGMAHLSTGDILRDEIKLNTELGQKVESYMNQGNLVPDELIIGLIEKKLTNNYFESGFILDGFPRTLPQAEALKNMFIEDSITLDKVVLFMIEENKIISRMSGRRFCPECSTGYNINVDALMPKNDNLCDNDQAELQQRDDDKEETVKNRLEVYKKQTQPIEDFYRQESILVEVDAEQAPTVVFETLLQKVS